MVRLKDLAGGIAVISGAAPGGIGFGIAQHCLSLGMHVAIMDVAQTAMESSVEELKKEAKGLTVAGFVCDVTKKEDIASCHSQIDQHFSGKNMSALFCNAGIVTEGFGMVLSSSHEDWQLTLDVNVMGVLNRVIVEHIKANSKLVPIITRALHLEPC